MAEFMNKVVLVTGGAKGIGRGICLAFAREGAKVACADVDSEAGAEIVQMSAALAGEIQFHQADVSTSSGCQALVEQCIADWGTVHILCNNVGIQPSDSYLPAHELPEEMWDRVMNVNLKSGFLMTKYTVPYMQQQGGGVIINTASVQGLQSAYRIPAYAASKGGMLSLTRQLALDYAPDNIRVLAVNPGTIETPLVEEAAVSEGVDMSAMRTVAEETHPIGRIGQPEDIANVVLFLASDKASFMTGEYVCIDGGLMAKGAWA